MQGLYFSPLPGRPVPIPVPDLVPGTAPGIIPVPGVLDTSAHAHAREPRPKTTITMETTGHR